MKIFFLDLWHDLRAKRLWPVALVLAGALVAVPFLLSKSAEAPPAPAPATSAKAEVADKEALAALAEVKLQESDDPRGSTLGVFDPDDPFLPPKVIAKRSRPGSSSASSTIESDQTDSGSTGGGSTAATDGGSGGGDTPSTGGGDTGGYDKGSGGGGGETTTAYKYVVDVTFRSNGRTRHINGLEKLDLLPSQASPLLIFMGVTPKGSDAVFLVDATLTAAGEGRCQPSPDECALAYIGAGSEHVFTDEDGDTYTVRIDEIRKVEVGAQASKAGKGATADAAITRVTPMRVGVGALLTIGGRNFKSTRSKNTVIFRGPDGRTAFAKPRRASERKLVVAVPAAVARLVATEAGAPKPTRFKLRVLAGKLTKYTSRRLSPVVVPTSVTPAG
jgi:hypothetical protein